MFNVTNAKNNFKKNKVKQVKVNSSREASDHVALVFCQTIEYMSAACIEMDYRKLFMCKHLIYSKHASYYQKKKE